MNIHFRILSISLMILLTVIGCSSNEDMKDNTKSISNNKENVELIISAAASLKDAMEAIQRTYEEEHDHVQLKINFGGSGSLQQQISQGAPADLFFSAAEDKFALLVEEGEIVKEDGTNLLENSLVLIVPKGQSLVNDFPDLKNSEINKIAIGIPETVPAGRYSKDSLETIDVWQEIESKVVYAKDVRQVLSYVETGNVEAGVVYKTDAQISDKVEVVAEADPMTHAPIIYPVGVIKDSKQSEAAKVFYEYLQTEETLKVFDEYGFTTK